MPSISQNPAVNYVSRNNDLGGSLEEFDLLKERENYIWADLAPVVEVSKSSGQYGRLKLEELLKERTTLRAPGAGYNRDSSRFEADNYSTVEHGAEEVVDDNLSEVYKDFFDAEMVARNRCFGAIARNAEKRWAAAIFDTAVYTGAALTTAIGTAWTAANSTPIDNVEAAVQKVWENTGLWPNTIILNRHEFRNLRNNAQILDRISSNGAGSSIKAGDVTRQQIAECFDLEKVLVGGGAENTANENQTRSISKIWDDSKAMVCVTAMTDDIAEPCIARTFHWSDDGSEIFGAVETYRDESVRGDVVRVRHQVGEKIIYTQCGHLLTGI